MAVQYKPTSHENLPHDSIDSLGYDWERVANPAIRPKYPFKIYLPRTTEDVIAVVNEARQLGQTLGIRSRGHSSNDLVLVDKGAVLCTEKLNKVIELNPRAMTVKVQAGVVLANLDEMLAKQGYGLPVVGDHDDITAGGFASVGGISPTSHRYGMFVDNIAALEYVNWDGEPIRCSKTENRDEFYRLLTGTGQYGVIATLTLNIVRVDKYRTILKNDRKLYIGVNEFVEGTTRLINEPGDTLMQRAAWFDFAEGRSIGQISAYKAAPHGRLGALTNTLSYGYLHTLGFWAGRLPEKLDVAVKYLGTLGLIFAPVYASIKNVERFSDRVLDSSVGDPSRFLITLAPAEAYPTLFDKLYTLCRSFRTRHKCFTFITLSVKGIRSDYLSNGDPNKPFCELILLVGIDPKRMTDVITDDFVSQMDDLCIEHGAFRYMHTKTVKDPERRRLIDPNAAHARAGETTS